MKFTQSGLMRASIETASLLKEEAANQMVKEKAMKLHEPTPNIKFHDVENNYLLNLDPGRYFGWLYTLSDKGWIAYRETTRQDLLTILAGLPPAEIIPLIPIPITGKPSF